MVEKVINMQEFDAKKKDIQLYYTNLTNDDALTVNLDE